MLNPFQAAFDRTAGPLFKARGLAVAATWERLGSDPVALIEMDVAYFDESVEIYGLQSQVPENVRTVRIFKRYSVPRPRGGDVITANPGTGDAEVFAVDALLQEDSSSYVLILVPYA